MEKDLTMQELLKRAEKAFSRQERNLLGVDVEEADHGNRMRQRVMLNEGVQPRQGIESDEEVSFYFEDWEDAQQLYEFMLETGLVIPGEIKIKHREGSNSVHFSSGVVVNKPEVIQGALIAYEDLLAEESENDYWDLAEQINELVDIRQELHEVTISGAPRSTGKGNPFHRHDDGKFGSPSLMALTKKGSWSDGTRKGKVTGVGKDKKGGVMLKFGATSHPCGRAAREKGKNKLCWTGKEAAGAIVKGLRAKRAGKGGRMTRRAEMLDMSDRIALAEMRQYLIDMQEIV